MIRLWTFRLLKSIKTVKNYRGFEVGLKAYCIMKWPWTFETRLWNVVVWIREVPLRLKHVNMWSLLLLREDYRMFRTQRIAIWSMSLVVVFENFSLFPFSVLFLCFCLFVCLFWGEMWTSACCQASLLWQYHIHVEAEAHKHSLLAVAFDHSVSE